MSFYLRALYPQRCNSDAWSIEGSITSQSSHNFFLFFSFLSFFFFSHVTRRYYYQFKSSQVVNIIKKNYSQGLHQVNEWKVFVILTRNDKLTGWGGPRHTSQKYTVRGKKKPRPLMIRHFFLNSNWLLFGSASKYPPSARSGEQMKGFFPHRPHE